ncbi:MAG: PKD domain-containing protein [Methanobacteriota archaeon]|nr:MAG: PKD domain-containing protein [Euryarchaeota archaeon]
MKNNDVITESLDESDDLSDYFKIYLEAGDVVDVIVAVPYGQDFDLYLYDESYDLRNKSETDNPGTDEYFEEVFLNATYTGWYYIEVYAFSGAGDYLLFAYATAEWTIMIYLDGDNNLETEAIVDFMEMSEVGSTDDVNIVVQFDRISGYDGSYGDWTGCERFLVTQGMTPEVGNSFESLGEVNMGSSQTLIDFGNMAIQWFPAHRYALVLWDHGASWEGVCWDDTPSPWGDSLTMPELNESLSTIVSTNDLSKLDIVWLDACNMASIEVACELSDYCANMVASEMQEPNTGANYDLTLSSLVFNPQMTAAELCQQIVSDFVDSYDSAPEPGYLEADVTQSAANLSEVSAIIDSVDALSSELAGNTLKYVNYIWLCWFEAQHFETHYVDLHDLAWKVSQYLPSETAKSLASDIMAGVNASVFAEGHWDMPGEQSIVRAEGMMIYFPYAHMYDSAYESGGVEFATVTHWDEFLNAYNPYFDFHNSPPSIVTYSPIGEQTMTEGDSLEFSVDATDPDGNALSYSWYVDNTPFAKDVTSVEYAPGYEDAGSHSVKVDVWDGDETVSHTWSVEVEEGDDVPPSSCVTAPISYWTVSAPMTVSAEASDDSGTVSEVSLWYRHSIDNSTWGAWTEFGTDSVSPWEWSFDFPEGNGYYEFYSIAVDDSSNQEDPPSTVDARCAYDGSPPVASFTVYPLIGDIVTSFEVNASASSDFKDPGEVLEVRWDWENDGVWDTDWTTEKTATHQYAAPGTYTVKLEVRDSDGLTDYATATVEVVEVIPEFSIVLVPVLSLLLVVVLAAWRRRTKTNP